MREKVFTLRGVLKSFIKYLLGYYYFVNNGWLACFSQETPKTDIAVCYGHRNVPNETEYASGGMVKFQRLQKVIPNSVECFNILYLGSSSLPRDWRQILWLARRKNAKIVLNQNGVMYPKHGPGWKDINSPMEKLVHAADFVFYQSKFCQSAADRFLGSRSGPSEVLYNAVDTNIFTPLPQHNAQEVLTIMLGGNQYEFYRLEVALKTLAILANKIKKIRLLITGNLNWIVDQGKAKKITMRLLADLGISDKVDFVGTYRQAQAPMVYNQAQILLHTKHNDPCPGLVVEAMACGLPVVCSDSGGVPELVGSDAGICIPVAHGWDKQIYPDSKLLADAVLAIADNLSQYSEAARQRAVDNFDLKPWVQRHIEVFSCLRED